MGAEVQSITREILYGRGTEPSSFVDRDPSANFDLELIRTPQGMSSNVALRGRAVEPNGRGVGGVPVSVSLTYEPLAARTCPFDKVVRSCSISLGRRPMALTKFLRDNCFAE